MCFTQVITTAAAEVGRAPLAGAGRPRPAAGSETKARMRQPHETLPDRTHLSQARAQLRAFAIESGRVLLTLDADFANILRFPPASTPGVIRLKIHPPTEEAIREQIHRTLEVLKDTPLVGCLAVSHGSVIRIRS